MDDFVTAAPTDSAEARFGAVRTDIRWIDQFYATRFLTSDAAEQLLKFSAGKPDPEPLIDLLVKDEYLQQLCVKYRRKGSPANFEQRVDNEVQEMIWKQDHPQRNERLDDIFDEAEDFIPPILDTCGIDPQTNSKTVRLMETASLISYAVVVHYKEACRRPRPHQVNRFILPAIPVPSHYSYPSGHSTQAHTVCGILKQMFSEVTHLNELDQHLQEIETNIAENREWAGVHYESDTAAGKALAARLVTLLLEKKSKTTNLRQLFDEACAEWQ